MSTTPAVALQRRQEAVAKLTNKLEALERLLTEGDLDKFPSPASVSSFASWEDRALGVYAISRSVLYDDAAEYLPLRRRMATLLARLSQLRSKHGKKASQEASLRTQLEVAKARAQSYVDQYSTVMSELVEARHEIERLKLKLSRQSKSNSKVIPLHQIGKNNETTKT